MVLNPVKLAVAVTFMKYLATAVSLMVLLKTLIGIKIVFLISNLLKPAELVVNELRKAIFENVYQYSFLYLIYHC